MKVIINASTMRIGGGLQATHSFIDECRGVIGFTFHVFLSAKLRQTIDRSTFSVNFIFYDIAADASTLRRRQELRKELSSLEAAIIFLGKVDLYQCPPLYQQADAMFLPTLLECFSASYVEAMKMDRMILTSKLPFALHICGEAALYFDPMSPVDIGDVIYRAATSPALRGQLSQEAGKCLARFSSAKERAGKYLTIMKESYETAHPVL